MHKIMVIVGPTGVGKTKLSIALAKHFNGEIINGDSMQIYKGLDIGTAKIKEAEKDNIPHHLFDIRDVMENYTVYDYQKDGRKIIEEIKERQHTPIVVGGTGLYIKALLYDYRFSEEKEKNNYDDLTNEQILQKIKDIDINIDIHVNNRKRLVRTLNRYQNNVDQDNDEAKLLFETVFIGLTTERDQLYDIINKRVDIMINDGLVDEVKKLYEAKIYSKAIMTGIGYKELYKYFNHEITYQEAIDLIKKNSRHYAKRQYTWFKNKMNINWFDVNYDHFDLTIEKVIEYIKNTNN